MHGDGGGAEGMKSITLGRGSQRRRYSIETDVVDGWIECTAKNKQPKTRWLYVDPRLQGQRIHLNRAIHEALHGEFPNATHDFIERAADAATRIAWGLGCRLPND